MKRFKPIFIISNPRSGSTLLRSILCGNSLVSIPHEFPLIQEIINWNAKKKSTELLLEYLNGFKHFRDWGLDQVSLKKIFSEVNSHDVASTAIAVYSLFLEPNVEGKQIWGEKNIGNISIIGELATLFPEAKFIFLVRDPRAVVSSILKRNWLFSKFGNCPARYLKSIYGASSLYMDGEALLVDAGESVNQITVLYEDLVENPEKCLKAVCSFLCLPYESKMLIARNSQDISLSIPEARLSKNHINITKPISSAYARSFSKHLSRSQIEIIEAVTKPALLRHKYKPSTGAKRSLAYYLSKLNNEVTGSLLLLLIKLKKRFC